MAVQEPQGVEQSGEEGDKTGGKAPRGAGSESLWQDEPEIERTNLDQHSFVDVGATLQMGAPHPAGIVGMREAAFDALGAHAEKALASLASNPSPVGLGSHRTYAWTTADSGLRSKGFPGDE